MKSIAYLAAVFPAPSETFVYREVRGLRQRGWKVCCVSLHDPPERPDSFADLLQNLMVVYGSHAMMTVGYTVAELLRHPLRSLATLALAFTDAVAPGEPTSPAIRVKLLAQAIAALGLAGRLRRAGIRHIHCHFAHAPTTVGMYAAHQLGIGFSFAGHANDIFQRRALLKKKLRRADFVACISRWHRAFYEGVAPGNYVLVHCGVDVAAWPPVAPHVHAGLPSTNSEFRILTVCRLVDKKGVDTLLRALHTFTPSPPSHRVWHLTIAGDGPLRSALESLAAQLNLADHVRFLGTVANEQVAELLAAADVFALPCRPDSQGDRDGIPVVLMEAMARAVPVVAGDLPAIRELVEDGRNGFLIEGNDPTTLADRLAQLAADSDLRHRLGAAGRQRVVADFSLAANLDELERCVNESLAAGMKA